MMEAQRPCRILLLCTANQCRSPMAAALLAGRLSGAQVHAQLKSAGILERGRPAWPEAVAAMAERGFDLTNHRSRHLEGRHVVEADLVVGMAREHVREAVALVPEALDRAFTLKELVRRAEALPRARNPLAVWLASLNAGRDVTELLGAASMDDVDDPIGAPLSAFRDTAAELDDLLARLVQVAWPSP
jgi:protein-tyrosine phosphatase